MYLRTGRVGGKVLDTLVEGVAYPLGAIWLDRRWTSYTAWAARCCVSTDFSVLKVLQY